MNKGIIVIFILSQIIFFGLLPVWLELTLYLHDIVLLVFWFCYSSLVVFVIFLVKQHHINLSRKALHTVFSTYSLGLLILLFFRPSRHSLHMYNLQPFKTIRFYLTEQADFLIAFYNLGANIGLFIPFGVYYCYVTKNATISKLIFLSIGVIGIIEGLQFITRRGSLDIDDLILNVLGVTIGYIVSPVFQKVFVMKERI
jgi:glycopeptide antibiotics resistance protein